MTYNRMEAKPIAGEHCRFCGDAKAPLVKTPCCDQWICCDTRKVKISERIDMTEVTSPPHSTIDLSSAPLSPIIKADSR